jgi:hypothetical protein
LAMADLAPPPPPAQISVSSTLYWHLLLASVSIDLR